MSERVYRKLALGDVLTKPRVLGTTRRGRVKVTSPEQMAYLHQHRIDHTHYVYSKAGRLIRKVRHVWPHPI